MGILHEPKLNKKLFLLFGYESTGQISKAYLELLQISKMELCEKIVNGFKSLIAFSKSFMSAVVLNTPLDIITFKIDTSIQ